LPFSAWPCCAGMAADVGHGSRDGLFRIAACLNFIRAPHRSLGTNPGSGGSEGASLSSTAPVRCNHCRGAQGASPGWPALWRLVSREDVPDDRRYPVRPTGSEVRATPGMVAPLVWVLRGRGPGMPRDVALSPDRQRERHDMTRRHRTTAPGHRDSGTTGCSPSAPAAFRYPGLARSRPAAPADGATVVPTVPAGQFGLSVAASHRLPRAARWLRPGHLANSPRAARCGAEGVRRGG
jgi:hypothetical protein